MKRVSHWEITQIRAQRLANEAREAAEAAERRERANTSALRGAVILAVLIWAGILIAIIVGATGIFQSPSH